MHYMYVKICVCVHYVCIIIIVLFFDEFFVYVNTLDNEAPSDSDSDSVLIIEFILKKQNITVSHNIKHNIKHPHQNTL